MSEGIRKREADSELLSEAVDLLRPLPEDRTAIISSLEADRDEWRLLLEKPPIRVKQLASALTDIQESARRLASMMERYDDTLLEFDPHDLTDGTPIETADGEFVYRRKAYFESPVTKLDLLSLSKSAREARHFIVDKFGTGDLDKPDRGGPALDVSLYGTSTRSFIYKMIMKWASHRPDCLVATIDGELARFVELMYQWVSGKEELRGLADNLKHIVPRLRCRIALLNRAHELMLMANNLRRIGDHSGFANQYIVRANRIYARLR